VPNQNKPTFKQVKPTSAAHAAPEDLFHKLSGTVPVRIKLPITLIVFETAL